MLACARLGVMHSVVFAGFSASALKARINDADAKFVITTDGQYRRDKPASLKDAVDEAVEGEPSVEHVIVLRRTGIDVAWTEGRDLWWHESVEPASPEHTPEAFDSEHPLSRITSLTPPPNVMTRLRLVCWLSLILRVIAAGLHGTPSGTFNAGRPNA